MLYGFPISRMQYFLGSFFPIDSIIVMYTNIAIYSIESGICTVSSNTDLNDLVKYVDLNSIASATRIFPTKDYIKNIYCVGQIFENIRRYVCKAKIAFNNTNIEFISILAMNCIFSTEFRNITNKDNYDIKNIQNYLSYKKRIIISLTVLTYINSIINQYRKKTVGTSYGLHI